jgi:hypothetical protein
MAELAGYIGQQQPPTDFNKISTDLTDRLIALDEKRRAEQEKIDDFTAEAYSKVGDVEATTSQSYNQFMFNTIDKGRSSINMWNDQLKKGLMTRAQYKKLLLTLNNDMGVLNKVGKTYSASASELSKKMLAGEVSKGGIFKIKKFNSSADLTNQETFISPTGGSIFIGKTNPDTGEIKDQTTLAAVTSFADASRLADPTVDLAKHAKGLGDILKGVGIYQELPGTNGVYGVVESAKNAANYEQIIASQVSSVLSSPEAYAAVLGDYGGYDMYQSEDEKAALIKAGNKNLIKYNYAEGQWKPEIDKTLQEKAQEIVKQNFEASLGTKITNVKTPPPPDKPTSEDRDFVESLGLSMDSWRDIKNPTSANLTDATSNVLTQALGNAGFPNVKIKKYVNPNGVIGVNIYREGEDTPAFTIKKKSDLHKLLLLRTGNAASGELNYRRAVRLMKEEGKYVPYSAMLKKYKESGASNMSANDYKKQLEDAGYFIDEDQ